MSTHKCRADGCDRQIKVDFLMCPPHWRLVPRSLQAKVYAAWDEYKKASAGDVIDGDFADVVKRLRAVQAEAAAAVGIV